ncbi:phage tail protein [Streptomyces violascens]|uniref:phage tail protein n=1 Tax=Streptomyces violascens TaxID=67381 RepID=UPI0016789107|nr:phage tail protein [Streptomyces violascens]GGU51784.1 hypothetical protein GCM10010289_85230 [Streptomyces violascens]
MVRGDACPVGTFTLDLGGGQVETIQPVSGLQLQQAVVEIRPVSARTGEPLVQEQPGPARPGEITVTRGVDLSRAVTDWINASVADHDIDGARRNVTVVQYDVDENPVRRYRLSNARATGLELAMDATGIPTNTEQVTIAYEELTIETC